MTKPLTMVAFEMVDAMENGVVWELGRLSSSEALGACELLAHGLVETRAEVPGLPVILVLTAKGEAFCALPFPDKCPC